MRRNILFCIVFGILAGCGSVPPRPPQPEQAPQTPHASQAAPDPEAFFKVLSTLGVDYRRGGASPSSGFDCSGLVAYVYQQAYGIDLPHYTLAQSRFGTSVAPSALQLGDLVFYNTERHPYSHVGIYLGDGRFVHAPKPGSAVRIEKMVSSYWTKRFDGARRILQPTY